MKIEFIEDGIRLYVQNFYFKEIQWNDKEQVILVVKDLFMKIKKIYNINMSGLYRVKVYPHKFGVVITAILLDIDNYIDSDLDLRIVVIFNKDFYLKIDDGSLIMKDNLPYIFKDSFYINLNDIESIIPYIEYGEVVSEAEI